MSISDNKISLLEENLKGLRCTLENRENEFEQKMLDLIESHTTVMRYQRDSHTQLLSYQDVLTSARETKIEQLLNRIEELKSKIKNNRIDLEKAHADITNTQNINKQLLLENKRLKELIQQTTKSTPITNFLTINVPCNHVLPPEYKNSPNVTPDKHMMITDLSKQLPLLME